MSYIPIYLENKCFKKQKLSNDCSNFYSEPIVPSSTAITSDENFIFIMSSNKYWRITDTPFSMFDYVIGLNQSYNETWKNNIQSRMDFKINWTEFDIIHQSFFYGPDDKDFLINNGFNIDDSECILNKTLGVIEKGFLYGLKYFHSRGYDWSEIKNQYILRDEDKTPEFINLEKKDLLKFACLSTQFASLTGNLKCLKYCVENGCSVNDECIFNAIKSNHEDILHYLIYIKCPMNELSCSMAAVMGNLRFLQYLRQNNCPWDDRTTASAASAGDLECLKYAHECGCPWDESATEMAALSGSIPVMKYLYENKCPWDESTTLAAAFENKFEILKYAFEKGCPLHDEITYYAAVHSNLEMLKFAYESGCKWHPQINFIITKYNKDELIKYAILIGKYSENSLENSLENFNIYSASTSLDDESLGNSNEEMIYENDGSFYISNDEGYETDDDNLSMTCLT